MFCEMRLDCIKNMFLFRDAVELMEQLGHKQISTTLRYIHMSDQARSTLADRAGSFAMAGFNGKTKKADVVKL